MEPFFEIVLPSTELAGSRAIADYLDIAYYSFGSALAACFWLRTTMSA
jgi:hypothetical protein